MYWHQVESGRRMIRSEASRMWMPSLGRNRRSHGFTLVELLVVIGVIALLMSMLMPALGRANAAAKRTLCLSNLRSVYSAFSAYSQANRGQVPLGYRIVGGNPSKQYNSMVYSATTGKFVQFGLLYKAGLMTPPAAFFCPSETNPQSMLNTPTNPWPPGSINGFAGYAGRPDVVIPDDLSTAPPNALAKWSTFNKKAILSDVNTMPARVLSRHETGINVAYGDGSAKWVPYSVFKAELAPCTSLSAAFNANQDRVWALLDKR